MFKRYPIEPDVKGYLLARSAANDDGCRVWIGSTFPSGHGKFNWKGRKIIARAHRIAYEEFVGPIPDGLAVCHHCDNPRCINPAHLFLGTIADNHRDMVAKGRHAFGEKNGASRLTPWRVRVIRRAHAAGGWSYCELAKKIGLSAGTVPAHFSRSRRRVMGNKDLGADPALVPSGSSQQVVSTKGFDPGEDDYDPYYDVTEIGCYECDSGWKHACCSDMCIGCYEAIECPDAIPCRNCNPNGELL